MRTSCNRKERVILEEGSQTNLPNQNVGPSLVWAQPCHRSINELHDTTGLNSAAGFRHTKISAHDQESNTGTIRIRNP